MMRSLRKIFYRVVAIVVVPTILLVCFILWSHATGKTLAWPWAVESERDFLPNAKIYSAKVYDATGENYLGDRGYIKISAAELSSMTPTEYYNYYNNVLKSSNYLWFTFVCPDGTGLYIPNVADGGASYCTLDSMGRIVSPRGFIIVEGETCYYAENIN